MIILFSTSASKIIRFESEEKYLRKIRPIKYADVESRRIRPNRDFDATPFNHRRLIEMVKRRNDFNWNFWRRAHTHTHTIDVRPPERPFALCATVVAACHLRPFNSSIHIVIELPIFQFHGFMCIVSLFRSFARRSVRIAFIDGGTPL